MRRYSYDAKVCEMCGNSFERPANQRGATWANRTLCSIECVREARRRKAYDSRPERTCPMCGNTFRTRLPLSQAVTCGSQECKQRYKREVAAPKTAARMREAYARGERPKIRGISPREQVLWPLLQKHGWEWRHRWFDVWGCFEMDFSLFDRKMNVELDGPEHSATRRRTLDEARDAELERRGWKILRVPNAEVDESPERVAMRVLAWADSHR